MYIIYTPYNKKYYFVLYLQVYSELVSYLQIRRSHRHIWNVLHICATTLSHVSADASAFRPFPGIHLQFIRLQAGTLSPTFFHFISLHLPL